MPGLNVKVYECWVTGVRERDRVVDVKSRSGAVFESCSYLLPFISAAGVGIDVIPKTGDKCIVLASPPAMTNKGRMAWVIGFEITVNPGYQGLHLGGRDPKAAQGSITLRAGLDGDETGYLHLSPGGTVLVSANGQCRTVYSSIDSSIISLFDNWQLRGPGGYVEWFRDPGSEAVSYHARYATNVDLANTEDGGQAAGELLVDVRVGGEGEDPLDIQVSPAPNSDNPQLRVRVTSDGEAYIEGESINIIGRAAVNIDAANLTIKGRQVLGQGDPI